MTPKALRLARLYEETGRAEHANTKLIEALHIDPNNARALTALGHLRDHSGDHAQALANYQRLLETNCFHPEVAARVATLNSTGGSGATLSTGPTGARLGSDSWQPTVKY